jgi:AraC-like DNA-binding protein
MGSRPAPSDPLSDVLRAVKLTGAVFYDVEAFAPWASTTPAGAAIVPSVLPGAQHLISYHVVTEGACWASLLDGPPVLLAAGDVIVFPHGDPHVLSSDPGARGQPDPSFHASARLRPLPLRLGGDGPRSARLVCGYLGCDTRPFNPLVAGLPRLLHVPSVATGEGWLGQVARAALAESRQARPGGESVLARLSELMFVEAVRRYIDTLPDERTGWLAGLRDTFVGRALALLHERLDHPWTIEDLAREVALSRSALAERFTRLVGDPPIQYLARWRMQVAAGLLAEGAKVAAAARAVGYGSEAAFSRAFKKMVGTAPGNWREARPQGGGGEAAA